MMPPWFKEERRKLNGLGPVEMKAGIRELMTRVRAEFEDKKLCIVCGDKRRRGKFCLRHAASQDQRAEKRRERLRDDGLCVACGQEFIAPGSDSRCQGCLDKAAAATREEHHERLRLGLCSKCGDDAGGKYECEKCSELKLERMKNLRATRKEAGLCTSCGGERDDQNKGQCLACRDKRKKKPSDRGAEIVAAMKTVLEYETEWFVTGTVFKDEKYLVAKELVESQIT